MVGEVLDLVGNRAAVDLAQRGQRLAQRLAGHVHAQQRGRNPRLQLGCERRDQPCLVERGIAERLRAERIEARGEMAVHPMGLDERHRRGDTAEERLVDLGRQCVRRLGSRLGRWLGGRRRGGRVPRPPARMPVAALERLEQAQQAGMRGNERAVAALEELPPLLGDRVGVLEVVLEHEPGVAGVQAVDFRACSSSIVERFLGGDRDRHARRPAHDRGGRRRCPRCRVFRVVIRADDEREQDRDREQARRALDERRAPRRRSRPSRGSPRRRRRPSSHPSVVSCAHPWPVLMLPPLLARAPRILRRPPRGGSGRSGRMCRRRQSQGADPARARRAVAAPSSGRGSALIAHQTTAQM